MLQSFVCGRFTYHSLILAVTWTGAFPFPGNPTWLREHSASISNKMTTGWCVGVGVCGQARFIRADGFVSVSLRKPQELPEGPSPEEGMEKYS